MLDVFAERGNERDEDDADDQQGEIVLDDRNVAEEVTGQREAANPGNAAQCAEHKKQTIAHATDTRHERGKSADDGKKARKDDGLAPCFA